MEELNNRFDKWKSEANETTDWEAMNLSGLIDYILKKHHSYLQEELTQLEMFVARVYQVHGGDHPHLIELYSLYNEFKASMKEHIEKEEMDIFPVIQEFEQNPTDALADYIQKAILHSEKEHAAEIDILNKIRDITNAFTPPAGACNTYRITYARLAELEENAMQHVHVENNILFKRLNEKIAS